MSQMNQMQEQMQQQLAGQTFSGTAGGGAVTVTCNGLRTITDVSIDADKVDSSDTEALEDLIVVAVNAALEQAVANEADQSNKMMNSMLPGGLGSLFGG